MDFLKALFENAENGTLSFEQFVQAAKDAKLKLVDLSTGDYVSKNKHDDEISQLNSQITTLNDTIKQRDTDLSDLQEQLKTAGTDADKLATVQSDLTSLQSKYENDVKEYKAQLKRQAYEFAVKDFANSKNFTSKAAKRDFIQSMIAKDLKLENDKILGADDFVTAYSKENDDAFVVEQPKDSKQPDPKPSFVDSTPGGNPSPTETNAFTNAFHFTGVRPKE